MNATRFTLVLPQELLDWLDRQADAQHRSRNKQIIYILQILKSQSDIRHTMQDERWLDMQARKFPPGDRIG